MRDSEKVCTRSDDSRLQRKGALSTAERQLDKARRKRLRYAERKLKEAQGRLARANRGISYWSHIIADLRHERIRAVQAPLWPDGELKNMNGAGPARDQDRPA